MKQASEPSVRQALEAAPSGIRKELSVTHAGPLAASDHTTAPARIKSILVPTDFSAESKKAIAQAALFARQFGAKLTLIHVVEPSLTPDFAQSFPLAMSTPEVVAICERELKDVAGQMQIEPDLIEKTMVVYGRSFHEIVNAARTLGTDLIIISTHGYTGLKHALLGSTAERVVQHAPCMVLVLRSPEFVQT